MAFKRTNLGSFSGTLYSLDEGVAFLQDIADAYPQITALVSLGLTVEGRDIWALKITDQPDIDEPEEERILFTGLTHAREWATHEMMLYMVQYLTSGYDTDPEVRHIVDNAVVWLVPAVNPDGYRYSWFVDRMWRKNRGEGGVGVDLMHHRKDRALVLRLECRRQKPPPQLLRLGLGRWVALQRFLPLAKVLVHALEPAIKAEVA